MNWDQAKHDEEVRKSAERERQQQEAQQAQTKLLILVPTTGKIDFFTNMWTISQGPPCGFNFIYHKHSGYVEDVRQEMADFFMEQGIEWTLWLDADVTPTVPAVVMLQRALEANVKLVAYPVPFISRNQGVTANIWWEEVDPNDPNKVSLTMTAWDNLRWPEPGKPCGLNEIASAGLGCTLIHRSVIATLIQKALVGESDWPFRGFWDKGRIQFGEDQAFFIRAKHFGFQPYTDLACPAAHNKVTLLDPKRLQKGFVAPADTLPQVSLTDSPIFGGASEK